MWKVFIDTVSTSVTRDWICFLGVREIGQEEEVHRYRCAGVRWMVEFWQEDSVTQKWRWDISFYVSKETYIRQDKTKGSNIFLVFLQSFVIYDMYLVVADFEMSIYFTFRHVT